MHHLSTLILGGALVALAIDGMSGEFAARWQGGPDTHPTTSALAVNRDTKGNRLPISANDMRSASHNVKVAGPLDHVAGPVDLTRAILFNPTPMMAPGSTQQQRFGTFSVGLGTVTPAQPTVSPDTPVRPVPAKSTPPRLPDACDPAFSPIAAPTLAHIIGRCLT